MKMILAVFGALAMLAAPIAQGVQLDNSNKDAVRLEPAPYWNLQLVKSSATVYKLRGKGNKALSGPNYGMIGIGSTTYEQNADISLTQDACVTDWGSASDTNAYLYAAYANTYATSVSDTSPSTNISGGSDTNFKVAVDQNPVVSVTLTLTGLNTGSAIATGLTTAINAALDAAGQAARVDVAYGTVYTATSRNAGARSSVVFTAGTTLDVADDLKLGVANSGVEVAGVKGMGLCASNVGSLTTVGSTAVGNSGYMQCSRVFPSATPVRQIAAHALNCSGPVIGTIVETAPVLTGSIVNGDISATAAIDFSKLAGLTSTDILIGSAGNVATATAVTGDVTIGNTGVTAIGAGKVTEAMNSVPLSTTLSVKRYAMAIFDPSTNAGERTVAAHTISASLPAKAIVTRVFYDVKTTFTSAADTATIALSYAGADDVVSAIAIGDGTNPWDAGLHDTALVDGTFAKYIKGSTSLPIVATVAVQALTAGKMRIFVEYVLSE